MGMYTQLHYGVRLKKETPPAVLNVLRYMVGECDAEPSILPAHPLFTKGRWHYMLRCDSYYFDYKTTHYLHFDDISDQWYFNVTTNLKDYEGEIEAFVDWMMPYVDAMAGECLGYSRYEETETPTLIVADQRSESSSSADAGDPQVGSTD